MGRFRSFGAHPDGIFGSTFEVGDGRPRPPWLNHIERDRAIVRGGQAVDDPMAEIREIATKGVGLDQRARCHTVMGANPAADWKICSWRRSCNSMYGETINMPQSSQMGQSWQGVIQRNATKAPTGPGSTQGRRGCVLMSAEPKQEEKEQPRFRSFPGGRRSWETVPPKAESPQPLKVPDYRKTFAGQKGCTTPQQGGFLPATINLGGTGATLLLDEDPERITPASPALAMMMAHRKHLGLSNYAFNHNIQEAHASEAHLGLTHEASPEESKTKRTLMTR